jgi:hypothetical protein
MLLAVKSLIIILEREAAPAFIKTESAFALLTRSNNPKAVKGFIKGEAYLLKSGFGSRI